MAAQQTTEYNELVSGLGYCTTAPEAGFISGDALRANATGDGLDDRRFRYAAVLSPDRLGVTDVFEINGAPCIYMKSLSVEPSAEEIRNWHRTAWNHGLRILYDAWPATAADSRVTKTTDEDSISNVLRWQMVDAKNRLVPVPDMRFEREPQSDDPELDNPLGLIDIKVLYTWHDETYLTMECKRITSTENSLALKYVRNGINRFASGKYSPGHAFGIILGYVICGDLKSCADRISHTLAKEPETETGFDSEFGWTLGDELIELGYEADNTWCTAPEG